MIGERLHYADILFGTLAPWTIMNNGLTNFSRGIPHLAAKNCDYRRQSDAERRKKICLSRRTLEFPASIRRFSCAVVNPFMETSSLSKNKSRRLIVRYIFFIIHIILGPPYTNDDITWWAVDYWRAFQNVPRTLPSRTVILSTPNN